MSEVARCRIALSAAADILIEDSVDRQVRHGRPPETGETCCRVATMVSGMWAALEDEIPF